MCLPAAELPYEVHVVPVSYKPLPDGSVRVAHHILVNSENVKKIVVGKNGAAIGVVGR
jgi:GTPase Era involved in 16S rRNA processing